MRDFNPRQSLPQGLGRKTYLTQSARLAEFDTLAHVAGHLNENDGLVSRARTASQPETPNLLKSRFSTWLPEPPADPQFLRRVVRLRWEKGLAAIVLVMLWSGFVWLLTLKHSGAFAGVWNALFMGTGAIWMRARSRRASPYLEDLLDLPATCAQFPVELTYRFGRLTYGSDAGIVSFVDGWMHFQGRRTSWTLNAADSSVDAPSKSNSYGTADIVRTVHWRNNGRGFSIKMVSMDRIEGLGGGLRKRFAIALIEWQQTNFRISDDIVLPPVVAVPGLVQSLDRSLDQWLYAVWASIVIATIMLAAYIWVPGFAWWPAVAGLALIFITTRRRATAAHRLWTIYGLLKDNCGSQTIPDRPLVSKVSRSLKTTVLKWRSKQAMPELKRWVVSGEENREFPVAVQYVVASQVYQSEWGILTVADGVIRFSGQLSEWSINAGDAMHVDPANFSFYSPEESAQYVQWEHNGSQFVVSMSPLERFPGLGRHLDTRLAEALVIWEKSIASATHITHYPTTSVQADTVHCLEAGLARWSIAKQISHVIWIGGILLALEPNLTTPLYGIGVIVTGVTSLITAEYRRGKLASRLEAVYYYCDGGRDLVSFRRGEGPWWRRIRQPWVK